MTYEQATRTIRKLLAIIDRLELSNDERRFVSDVRDALPGDRGRPRANISDDEIRRAVNEHGSRTAAALNLGVSVSTIYRRLKS